MFRSLLVAVLILDGISPSLAGQPQTFEQFDAAGQFDRALAAVDAIRARKRLQCILATAERRFCQCLAQKLPLETYPRSYPAVAQQDAEFQAMSDPDKGVVRQCLADSH